MVAEAVQGSLSEHAPLQQGLYVASKHQHPEGAGLPAANDEVLSAAFAVGHLHGNVSTLPPPEDSLATVSFLMLPTPPWAESCCSCASC